MVLLDHVARNREEVGLRTSNLLVLRGPKKSHEDLLGKVRYIGGVAGPMTQKSLQAPAVFSGDAGNESIFVERAQPPSPG
jgi:hypothetical protein